MINYIYLDGVQYRRSLRDHPLYMVWAAIKTRCYNGRCPTYHLYGGAGVVMCQEWINNPIAFIQWAINSGWKKGLVIDKDIIPKRKNTPPLIYSPTTCSVVTQKQNMNCRANNTFVEFNGESKTLKEWSEKIGISYLTMMKRIKKYSVSDALTKPKHIRRPIKEGYKIKNKNVQQRETIV